jgi:hypothetical protein
MPVIGRNLRLIEQELVEAENIGRMQWEERSKGQ